MQDLAPFIIILLCSLSFLSSADHTKDFGHGCSIRNSIKASNKTWYSNSLPFLDCSDAGLTRLQINTSGLEAIRSISLSYNKLIQLHVDELRSFPHLQRIEIQFNRLYRFVASKNNLTLQSVSHLSLAHNVLRSIPKKALKSFPNLKFLHLQHNSIITVTNDDFKFSKQLQHLHLGPNPIKNLQDGWMSRMNLTSLNLRSCGLNAIPKPIASIRSLQRVSLTENEITFIPARAFIQCSALRFLGLRSNKIHKVDKDSFKGARNLKVINLSDNRIETLVSGAFDEISDSELSIDLNENPLNCSCTLLWFKTWIKRLQSRDMSSQVHFTCYQPARNHGKKSSNIKITDFDCKNNDRAWKSEIKCRSSTKPRLLPVNKKLQTCNSSCYCFDENGKRYHKPTEGRHEHDTGAAWLRLAPSVNPSIDCARAAMTEIPRMLRLDIRMIRLYGNNLFFLHLHSLMKYEQLRALILIENNISTIKINTDVQIPTLKTLKIHHNKLKKLTKEHLKAFPNLEHISLGHNLISAFSENLFEYNRKLFRVTLGPNPVSYFNGNCLNGLPLEVVVLRELSITDVPLALQDSMTLTSVDLRDNHIANIASGTFSKCKRLKSLNLENNKISHISENAFNGAVELHTIKLAGNDINILPKHTFAGICPRRISVTLSENPIVCDCKLKPFKRWLERMEATNSFTDIQFRCLHPPRLKNKLSYHINSHQDLKCNDAEERKKRKSCNVSGRIALAVLLSMSLTAIACAILWKCKNRRPTDELQYFAKFY